MNQVMELPAEANPLTLQNLYNTLIAASSTHQQQIQTGTKQLQSWETQPKFYSSLQSIFIDTSLPVEVRYLSAIQLKNGINKYWRKTATNAIGKDERSIIRLRCIESGVNEPNHLLALQNALTVAKIVRFEYPQDWPDAITSIINHLRLASQPRARTSNLPSTLLILLHVVKELATGRLQRMKENLQSLAPEMVQVLGDIYIDRVYRWKVFAREGGDDEGGALNDIEQSLLVIRVLRRLVIAGYEYPNRHTEVQELWKIIAAQTMDMHHILRESHSLNSNTKCLIEKHLVQIAKFHLEMATKHPRGYALLPESVNLARVYWQLVVQFGETFGSQSATTVSSIGTDGDADGEDTPFMERISLKGLLLIRACAKMVFSPAKTFKYQHAQDKEERVQSTELMKTDLLTGDFARETMETIVTRFFVFRSKDLRQWEEEPEEWEKREDSEGDSWEYSIRSCSEKLFLDLMINYRHLLVQPLLGVFDAVAVLQNTDVLLKDSIYTAIGIAAPVLDQHLDFEAFLSSTLVSEVQIQQTGYNILRRRTAIILGQWLPVKDGLDRPLVYQIFQHLLDKNDRLNDQVVRVTAGRQLLNVIRPFEFSAENFMPYAPKILGHLMALVEEVELAETKIALLETLSMIVVSMEHHITPFADQIIALLRPLWKQQTSEEYIINQWVLTILIGLVNSLGANSPRYHSLIIPLIQISINPTSETYYLFEDALELWHAVLVQMPQPASPEILSLAEHLLPMLDVDSVGKALQIAESYVLLAPQEMLIISDRFFAAFTNLLPSSSRSASGTILHIIDAFISAANIIGGPSAIANLTTSLINTSLLPSILVGLKSAHDAHQSTGPNCPTTIIDGIVETEYLSVLARIALANPQTFFSVITTSFLLALDSTATVTWLLTEWFSHIDNIGDTGNKKLMCLGLTALLSTGQPWILSRLQELMTVWTDVVVELTADEEDGRPDCLVYWDTTRPEQEAREIPQEQRKRKIHYQDPIHCLPIKPFIHQHLHQAIELAGGRERFEAEWVVNIDRDVLAGFEKVGVA